MSTPATIDFRAFDDEVIGVEQPWKPTGRHVGRSSAGHGGTRPARCRARRVPTGGGGGAGRRGTASGAPRGAGGRPFRSGAAASRVHRVWTPCAEGGAGGRRRVGAPSRRGGEDRFTPFAPAPAYGASAGERAAVAETGSGGRRAPAERFRTASGAASGAAPSRATAPILFSADDRPTSGRQKNESHPARRGMGLVRWSAGQALHLHLPTGSGASFLGRPTQNRFAVVVATSSRSMLHGYPRLANSARCGLRQPISSTSRSGPTTSVTTPACASAAAADRALGSREDSTAACFSSPAG